MGNKEHSITIDLLPMAARLEGLGEEDEDAISRIVTEELGKASDTTSRDMANVLLSEARHEARETARFRRRYEEELRRSWKRPLELYDVILSLCTEVGSTLNSTYRSEADAKDDFKLDALTRLHARACLTSSEIGALLRSGHATGANARWRTLHELAVVAMFLSEREQEVAKRYLEHDAIARFRGVAKYQQFAARLGEEPLSAEEVEQAERSRNALIRKYGSAYDSDYGWASEELGKKTPKFSDIANAIHLEHWSPYVRLASDGVHAGPHASFFDLGLHPSISAISAGPSHFGLADPGGNALISLHQTTAALMLHCISLSSEADEEFFGDSFRDKALLIIEMKALQQLVEKADRAFVNVHKELEAGSVRLTEPPRVLDVS